MTDSTVVIEQGMTYNATTKTFSFATPVTPDPVPDDPDPVVPPEEDPAVVLANAKKAKVEELTSTCRNTTYAGVGVQTTMGVEHFPLNPDEKSKLTDRYIKAKSGETNLLFCSSNTLCRRFSADEILNIYTASENFVGLHETRLNHLVYWVSICTTIEDVNAITYASNLPADLQEHMDTLLAEEVS